MIRVCIICGSEFETTRLHARYCGDICKRKAKRGRKAAPPYDRNVTPRGWLIICAHCGEPKETTNPKTRYCSPACKQAAYRKRKKVTP